MNDKKLNKNYLFQAIENLLTGKASSEEEKYLISYYESFQDNKKWKQEIGDEDEIKNLIHHKILAKIKTPLAKKSRTPKRLYNVISYAAAIAVIFISYLFIFQNQKSDNEITKQAIKKIQPGFDKATLELANGKTIELASEKNNTIDSTTMIIIKNTGKSLAYTTLNETKQPEKEVSYNTLHIPTGGIYKLILADGTKVWLNSESSLKYPIQFYGEKREVYLQGEGYFEVAKSNKEFKVNTHYGDITVLGTHFNVSAYEDDKTFNTTLVEGKVRVTTVNNSALLTPGMQAKLDILNNNLTTHHIDTEPFTSWKDGQFYFEKNSLEFILTKMARWYTIEFSFKEESIKNEKFTGIALKNKPISELLDMICKTTNLKYTINKNSTNEKYKLTISKH